MLIVLGRTQMPSIISATTFKHEQTTLRLVSTADSIMRCFIQ